MVDSLDVSLLANYLCGNIDDGVKGQRQNDQYGLGDVDGNGFLTSTDLATLQNYIVGNLTVLLFPQLSVGFVGSGQYGIVNEYLADPVGVVVLAESTYQPVVGMDVYFAVSKGNGIVDDVMVSADADGYAATHWKPGTVSTSLGRDGLNNILYEINDQLQLTFQGGSQITFSAYAVPDEPDSFVDEWDGLTYDYALLNVNCYFYALFRLKDQYGNPIPYYPVVMEVESAPGDCPSGGNCGAQIADYWPGLGSLTSYTGGISPYYITGDWPGDYVY